MINVFGSSSPASSSSQLEDRLEADESKLQVGKSLEVITSGTTSIVFPGGSSGHWGSTINHNLGYTPAFLAFFVNGGVYQSLPYWDFGVSGSNLQSILGVWADTSNLYFDFSPRLNLVSTTIQIKYYLLREPAQ